MAARPLGLPEELSVPLSIAVDLYQRQAPAIATFGLTEIIPSVIWAIGALKSKAKTGWDYVEAYRRLVAKWNALAVSDPSGALRPTPAGCKGNRGCWPAAPPRVIHPDETLIRHIMLVEGVLRPQATQLFKEAKYIYQRKGFPMALNIGGILGAVGNIFGGGQNQIFQGISGAANLASQFFPTPSISMPTQQVALRPPAQATLGMMPAIGRGAMAVGRGFFNRFPNLATSMQQLRDRGQMVKRSQLWSILKRFGPEVLVTGGLLTAAAVSELMVAGPGRRRMNPANVHALRRAGRRIKSFQKLTRIVGLSPRRSTRGSGRCGTCRKSPCRC